jgi:hypothetical protein
MEIIKLNGIGSPTKKGLSCFLSYAESKAKE